jgi:mRNA interferase HicA
MKRGDLIRKIEEQGCILYRHGTRHDIYINHATGQKQPVPRHSEIDNILVKHIMKYLGLVK